MTFSCPNYDVNTEMCRRLDKVCVPGRPGCVLHGKVTFREDLDQRIQRAEERIKRQRKTAQKQHRQGGSDGTRSN
jgi:hypothetical protein